MDYRTYPPGQKPEFNLPSLPMAPISGTAVTVRRKRGPLTISLGIAGIVVAISAIFVLSNDPLSSSKMTKSQAERNEELRQKVLNGDLGSFPSDVGMAASGTPIVRVSEIENPTVALPPPPPPPPSEPLSGSIDEAQTPSYYPKMVTRNGVTFSVRTVPPHITPTPMPKLATTSDDGLAALDALIADHKARYGDRR